MDDTTAREIVDLYNAVAGDAIPIDRLVNPLMAVVAVAGMMTGLDLGMRLALANRAVATSSVAAFNIVVHQQPGMKLESVDSLVDEIECILDKADD